VSIGLVLALEYADPLFDPHAVFQKWKTHPFVKKILDGGKLVRYGAKSLPMADGTRCRATPWTAR